MRQPRYALILCLLITPALADRPIEARKIATHVVSGKVEAIYARESGSYIDYIIEIRVSKVEKGEGVKPGELFRASCYQRRPGAVIESLKSDTPGHDENPREGQEIRAFVKDQKGKFEGVYPDWFDVLKPKLE